ncbi:MAG TPA: hypothetical protein VF304_01920 [Casimicrobiaceae bacterium]
MPGKNADAARRAGAKAAPVAAAPRNPRLASRDVFYTRVRRAATYALALVAVTLFIGMLGYHAIEHMSWLDAFHQSALLLSGMGPVVDIKSTAGKIFDGIYALFCGVILLASTGLMFAPVIHRLLHRFHIEDAGD